VRLFTVGGEGFEPPRFTAGFKGSGAKRRRKRHTGGEARSARRARWGGHGARGAEAGFARAGRGRGHTGQRGGSGGGRRGASRRAGRAAKGPPWRRNHALGPTEELMEATEFVSGACHRCHRYRNRQPIRSRPSSGLSRGSKRVRD
jgi:hypothetical protein